MIERISSLYFVYVHMHVTGGAAELLQHLCSNAALIAGRSFTMRERERERGNETFRNVTGENHAARPSNAESAKSNNV